MDQIVNAGAVAYGIVLIAGVFLRAPVMEAFRIDALFLPHPSEKTRPLNALFGVLIAGYGAWSIWGG